MKPYIIISIIAAYFLVLIGISYLTSKKSSQDAFFTGDKKSPWFVVAYGMIGAALSGVTFVSLPGTVLTNSLHFGQFILGNIAGYFIITFVLIPLYYKQKLVSIYGYLGNRFGDYTYKTGSFFFLLSQSFGAALRMLLAIVVMREILKDILPIWALAIIFIMLIYAYTYRSGIKTIVWTDMLQTTFLLLALVIVVASIVQSLDLSMGEFIQKASDKNYLNFFQLEDATKGNYFWTQFISGMLIAIAMMGLDQNMMQKSLTIAKVKNAQKNTMMFSLGLGIAQLLFLLLGAMLYIYADEMGLSQLFPITIDGEIKTDRVFPFLSVTENAFGMAAAVLFILGITAAAFSSADSALTALTTSFCYDFLKINKKENHQKIKTQSHIFFSMVLFIIIVGFSGASSNIFSLIFETAAYTYSPLLGLFILGITTRVKINDSVLIPIVCILAPLTTWSIMKLLHLAGINLGFLPILIGAVITIIFVIIAGKIPLNKSKTKS